MALNESGVVVPGRMAMKRSRASDASGLHPFAVSARSSRFTMASRRNGARERSSFDDAHCAHVSSQPFSGVRRSHGHTRSFWTSGRAPSGRLPSEAAVAEVCQVASQPLTNAAGSTELAAARASIA